MNLDKVKNMVYYAAIYIPFNNEAILIKYYDSEDTIMEEQTLDETYTGRFFGIGEESGKEYDIEYNNVNLNEDMFYKLVVMEN